MAIRSTGHRDEAPVAAESPSTLAGAFRLFRQQGSPRVIAAGLLLAVVVRMAATAAVGLSLWDLVSVVAVVALIPFVEWFVHRVVLHATPRTIGGLRIDPGAGHREHHLRPASIGWVLLRRIDAAVFQIINAGVVAVVVGGPLLVAGVERSTAIGAVLTGVVVAVGGLAHYEWSHFLFHIAYRPRTARYRRLKANHRLHHWRNERYWLGITSNAGDRLLRTLPERSAVPRSETARTLGVDPEG